MIEKDKCSIKVNKPTRIGVSILEFVYRRPEVNSKLFEISNPCENLICLHEYIVNFV